VIPPFRLRAEPATTEAEAFGIVCFDDLEAKATAQSY
jgi:hypothetical protein